MCHLSPTVHLAWCILACGLQTFLIQHLWRYDRFKCLAWSSGKQPGAFKRIMTYSYLASVPALVTYTSVLAVLKYRNGYQNILGHGIVPTPFQLWPASDRRLLAPMYIVFSVAWGLELVTHLEELLFWLFLLHQGPTRREWFSSAEFKIWAIGSSLAVVGMPLTAILNRGDPLRSEAYIFLIGAVASTSITVVFFVVLFQFPEFLRRVKREGATGPVILRLVKFHELNILRVIFRLLMTIPLLVLGIDGIRSHHVINSSALWTDLLAFLAAVGMVVSSTLTLLIFFPRSLAEDSNWRPQTVATGSHASSVSVATERGQNMLNVKSTYSGGYDSDMGSPLPYDRDRKSSGLTLSKNKNKYFSSHFTSPSALTTAYDPTTDLGMDYELRHMEEGEDQDRPDALRVSGSEVELMRASGDGKQSLSEGRDPNGSRRNTKESLHLKVRMKELGQAVDAGLQKPPRPPRLHPYITSFTSPIDLTHYEDEGPRAI